MPQNFIFRPCAQSTIIRPLAEAICMVHGGRPVKYTDPQDNKEKVIGLNQLFWINLETKLNGEEKNIDGRQVAFWARHNGPIQLQVDINDIAVEISAKTTLKQAMAQYQQKYKISCLRQLRPR